MKFVNKSRLEDMTRETGNLVKILQIIAEVYETNLITEEIKKGFKTTLTFIQSKIVPETLQLAATQLSDKQKGSFPPLLYYFYSSFYLIILSSLLFISIYLSVFLLLELLFNHHFQYITRIC